MSRPRTATAALLFAAIAMAAAPASADLDDDLERAWAGAWVVTAVETASDCSGFYTNNEVHGGRTTSSGDRRFTAGELARVDKLNLKSERVDLFLSIGEPVLTARRDGPFTLYDEHRCKVQLMVEVPRPLVRAGGADPVNAIIAAVLARHDTAGEARDSEGWNRREREPLPADYAATLARHAAWQAEQVNARLAEVREAAVEDAARIVDRVRDDPDYLAGFAAGIEELRDWRPGGCSSLPSLRFATVEKRPSGKRGRRPDAVRPWKEGYKDGQLLAWALAVLREVDGCFVPLPAAP